MYLILVVEEVEVLMVVMVVVDMLVVVKVEVEVLMVAMVVVDMPVVVTVVVVAFDGGCVEYLVVYCIAL